MPNDCPSVADVLLRFRQSDNDKRNALQFLLEHADEVVPILCTLQTSKWDFTTPELIQAIGSPRADRCASVLVWAVGDANAPARSVAADALFALSNDAIVAATLEAAAIDPEVLDDVLLDARRRKHPVADELARKKNGSQ